MSNTTELGRSAPKSPQPSGMWRTRRRPMLLGTTVVLFLGATIAGYLLGRSMAQHPLETAMAQLQQLQPENQRLKKTNADQAAELAATQAKLEYAQSTLEAIMPKKDTYIINSNQSMIVAGGRLVIGLVGPPANSSVNININGKQQPAVTGDVLTVSPDPSTTCQVTIQSFDMFRAVVASSCAPAKSR